MTPRLSCLLLAACMALPAAQAQTAKATIGFITASEPELSLSAFRQGLRELGYLEGRDVDLLIESAVGNAESLPERAARLVKANPRAIVAGGSDAVRAVQRATTTIPIVMTQVSDAVGTGFVNNLARPGGNTTGLTSFAGELGAKRLQLIREMLPRAKRIAVMWDSGNPSHKPGIDVLTKAARGLRMEIVLVEIKPGSEVGTAWARLRAASPDAVLPLPDNWLVKQRAEFVRAAEVERLPVMYWRKEFVEAGGLIAYGADNPSQYRRAAVYVDKILRGTRPGELAVEQVEQYELFVNARAAAAAGVRIPQSVLVRASTVIQ